MSLEGKVALVTGAGTGIGLIIAQGFAKKGAKVYIAGRRLDVLKKAADAFQGPGWLIPLAMDVTKPDDIASAVRQVSEHDGKLNILVNNAGIANPLNDPKFTEKKLARAAEGKLDYDLETFDGFESIFKLNTSAPYFVTVAFIDLLTKGAKAGKGEGDETSSVINISACGTKLRVKPLLTSAAYLLSKAALELLTLQFAAGFAKDKLPIRVNAILSGAFKSDVLPEEMWETLKTNPLPGFIEPIPLRRFGLEEEMSQAANLLASNGYVNATNLIVDGGLFLLNP